MALDTRPLNGAVSKSVAVETARSLFASFPRGADSRQDGGARHEVVRLLCLEWRMETLALFNCLSLRAASDHLVEGIDLLALDFVDFLVASPSASDDTQLRRFKVIQAFRLKAVQLFFSPFSFLKLNAQCVPDVRSAQLTVSIFRYRYEAQC